MGFFFAFYLLFRQEMKFEPMSCLKGGSSAYGGGLEATFKGRDYPAKTDHMTLGITVFSFDGDTAIGASLEAEWKSE